MAILISPEEAVRLLDASVLIDLRDETSYSKHIQGAISVRMPAMLFKRFLKQYSPVRGTQNPNPNLLVPFLLSPHLTPIKDMLLDDDRSTQIIFYDGKTIDPKTLPQDSYERTIIDYFVDSGFRVYFISGGFNAISEQFPGLVDQVERTEFVSRKSIETACSDQHQPLSFIDNFIAVGSVALVSDVAELKRLGVTHIMTLTEDPLPLTIRDQFNTLHIPMLDGLSQELISKIEAAILFIESARLFPGGKIVVHCHAGISRSASIVIAYLMWILKCNVEEAARILSKHRTCISPNLNFVGQLYMFRRGIERHPQNLELAIRFAAAEFETAKRKM